MSLSRPKTRRFESLEDRRMFALDMVSLVNLQPGNAHNFYVSDDHAFFVTGDDFIGNRLWASDGTAEGTTQITLPAGLRLRDIDVTQDVSPSAFFFAVQRIAGSDRTLWASRGTNETTGPFFNEPATKLRVHGDKLFFVAGSDEAWISDGTPAGTKRLLQGVSPGISPSVRYSGSVAGTIYFTADERVNGGNYNSIWKSDGTPEGTSVAVSGVGRDWRVEFRETGVLGDRLFFTAGPINSSMDLWVTDGTDSGTHLIKDLPAGNEVESGFDFITAGDALYFTALDDAGVRRLWRTDGTTEGTLVVDAPKPFGGGFDRQPNMVAIDDILYFAAQADGGPLQLWRTDGTSEGTYAVQPSSGESIGFSLTNCHGTLFLARNNRSGDSIYISDGTNEGTSPVAAYDSAPFNARNDFACVNGKVLFAVTPSPNNTSLWALTPPSGDTNFDGAVDLEDLNNVRNHFGEEGTTFPGDVTGDEVVGLDDLNAVRNNFGAAPAEALGTRPRVQLQNAVHQAAKMNAAAADAVFGGLALNNATQVFSPTFSLQKRAKLRALPAL